MTRPLPDVVAAILFSEGRVLLQYRINTSRAPCHWGLPAGRVEAGETPDQAVHRELGEELGIRFDPQLPPVLVYTAEGGERFDVFLVTEYAGEIANKEPHRCAELRWCALDELPQPMTSATAAILRAFIQ